MTLHVSQGGGARSAEGRLLLPNASTVTVLVRDSAGTLISSQVFPLSGKTSVTASFSLEVLKTYKITATARSAAPAETLLYAGSTTVTLTGGITGVLYLLPVDANGDLLWPVVSHGSAVPSLTLAAGKSTTFQLTFGADASGFKLTSLPAGLEAYVQKLPNGTPVAGPPTLLSKATLGNDLLITYYAASGAQTLPSLGSFIVPVQSFGLTGPATLLLNDTANLTLTNLLPATTTDTQVADYNWTATGAVSVVAPGQVKAVSVGSATVTATSKSAGKTAQWTLSVANPPLATFDAVPAYLLSKTYVFTGTADSGTGGPGIRGVWIIADATTATQHDSETPSVALGWSKATTVVSTPATKSTWSKSVSGLAEGANRVWIRAVDNDGTVSSSFSTVDPFVDTVDPALTEAGAASFTTTGGFSFTGTATDTGGSGVSALTVKMDGGVETTIPISAGSWTYTIASPPPVGSHTYLFELTDKAGRSSEVSRSVTVNGQVAAPTFSVPGGTYAGSRSVTITTATTGATIRYTTDGSMPSKTVGNVYSGPVVISTSQTLKAIAYQTGWINSTVTSASYTITSLGTVADPVFSVSAGSYPIAQSVELTSTTLGASIRYTTDGVTIPTSTVGTLYDPATPIAVDSSQTIKAIAYQSGWTDSQVVSTTYTITSTVNLTFQIVGFEALGFGTAALVVEDGQTLVVSPSNPTLQAGGTAWQWRLDGVPLAETTGTATFDSLSLGLHTLFVSVTYDGIVYSGAIPITVNPVEAF